MRPDAIGIPNDLTWIEVYRVGPSHVRLRAADAGSRWEKKVPARGHKELLEDHGFEWDDMAEKYYRRGGRWSRSAFATGVARLAHEKPEFRAKLVPLLRQADTSLTGKTMENEHLRFHVYRGSVEVLDLTNAGKRGKKVEGFSLGGLDWGGTPESEKAVDQWTFRLKRLDYREAKKQAEALIAQFEGKASIKIYETSEKGVRVAPAGFGPFKKGTPEFEIDADWNGYVVRDRSDKFNLPACMGKGKRDVKRFYRWITDNWARAKRLTYGELTSLMSKEGFDFHSWCRMD